MLKTLGAQIKEFKKDSFLTPVFMILEVLMETVIPLMMASIIDNGVEKGDIHHIYVMGGLMIVTACVSLFAAFCDELLHLPDICIRLCNHIFCFFCQGNLF